MQPRNGAYSILDVKATLGKSADDNVSPLYPASTSHPPQSSVDRGRIDIVQFMLDKGCYGKYSLRNIARITLFHGAVGKMAMTQGLLAAGTNVSIRCSWGLSSLNAADT